MIYTAREMLATARMVEEKFGFIVVGVKKGFDIYEPGSIIAAIWGVDLPDDIAFTVLEWGSIADWRRQGLFLFKRTGKLVANVNEEPNARFVKLRRVANGAKVG